MEFLQLYGNDKAIAFDDLGYWAFILVIAAIFISLLIGNLLIQVIKPLKKALIPSPVLGGFILLIGLAVYKAIAGHDLFNTAVLEMITYHCLGIGFISTALKRKEKQEDAVKKENAKGIFNSSLVTVGGYLIQAIIGLAVSVPLFFMLSGNSKYPSSGVLVPMGFGQGPGQALNWGTNYSNYRDGTEEDVVAIEVKEDSGAVVYLKEAQDSYQAKIEEKLVGLTITKVDDATYADYVETKADAIVSVITSDEGSDAINLRTYSEFGQFNNGISFGLAVAAMGFIASAVGGLIFLNVQRKKGNKKCVEHSESVVEKNTLETYEGENEIPTSGTIDKFSVQLGLVILVYAISFGLIYLISKLCDASGVKFLINTVKPLFWGFNFIIGVGVASIFKAILNKLQKRNVVTKIYVNNYQLDRIAGFSFDVMVVAAIASIKLEAFKNPEFLIPLLAMGVLATIVTYWFCSVTCKHLYGPHGYSEESFLSLFGMLTGTASTGVILLREIDPEFRTPALNNMVFQTLWSVVLGAPVLLLMATVSSGWSGLILAAVIFTVYFAAIMVAIFRDKIFKKKAK